MATVLRSNNDRYELKLLSQLIPDESDYISPSSGCRCAFSPDDSLFAWTVGDCCVTLIPLLNTNTTIEPKLLENGIKSSVNINCGHLVRALTFACIPNINESAAFWFRSALCKNLFLVTGHTSGRIRIWDVITGQLLLQLLDHKDAVTDVLFIPDERGLLMSTSIDGTIKIWDLLEDGNLSRTLKTDGNSLYDSCISPDYKTIVTVGMSKIANVWESQNFSIRLTLNGHQHNVVACCFSPDGCLIGTASWDTSVIIWNAFNGNNLRKFWYDTRVTAFVPQDSPYTLRYNYQWFWGYFGNDYGQMKPPPRLIFAAGDNGNFIRGLSFSPDGYHLATVADDGFLRIWDILNDDEPEAISSITDGTCCAYSNSGRILAVGTRNGTVSVFKGHSCMKSLLFLCRMTIKKYCPLQQFDTNTIPERLINYLNYKEWE